MQNRMGRTPLPHGQKRGKAQDVVIGGKLRAERNRGEFAPINSGNVSLVVEIPLYDLFVLCHSICSGYIRSQIFLLAFALIPPPYSLKQQIEHGKRYKKIYKIYRVKREMICRDISGFPNGGKTVTR